jgi:putative ABC transport system ATP-binding protein
MCFDDWAIMTASIQARQLCFSFGQGELRKQILHSIDLDVQAGEVVLLTGPSGSGKTTLLSLIGALRSMQEGSLVVLGQELLGASYPQQVAIRRRIGFIFQAHNLLPFLTAQQNVELALELQPQMAPRQRMARALELLHLVGLGEKAGVYPGQLSGGQKQRVAIARALVGQPELLLADEPTASLDSQSGREVVALLDRLARQQHCAVLMVTHDTRVEDIADRVLHMEDGRILPPIAQAPTRILS